MHGNTKHGYFGTRTYRIWGLMLHRCRNLGYADYDPKWSAFECFLADMGEAPSGLTLDRKNNELGYSKDNCRWATYAEQSRNRTFCKYLTDGTRVMTVAEWARELKIPRTTLYRKVDKGLIPAGLQLSSQ